MVTGYKNVCYVGLEARSSVVLGYKRQGYPASQINQDL